MVFQRPPGADDGYTGADRVMRANWRQMDGLLGEAIRALPEEPAAASAILDVARRKAASNAYEETNSADATARRDYEGNVAHLEDELFAHRLDALANLVESGVDPERGGVVEDIREAARRLRPRHPSQGPEGPLYYFASCDACNWPGEYVPAEEVREHGSGPICPQCSNFTSIRRRPEPDPR